jgi:hypothetical protein
LKEAALLITSVEVIAINVSKGSLMQKYVMFFLVCLACFSPATGFAYGHYTVYSGVPADIYVDNEYSATITATQSLKLILSGPKTYVIGVRALETGKTYKESVTVGVGQNEHRDIRAFSPQQLSKTEVTVYSQIPAEVFIDSVFNSAVNATDPLTIYLSGPKSYVIEVRATNSRLIHREEVLIDPKSGLIHEIRAFNEYYPAISQQTQTEAPVPAQGTISREEMTEAINAASAKAKAEALAEEAARRSRAEKRDVTTKGIAHVVGVEANQNLPGSVKNMERIKLLFEAIPAFKK